jgi:quercetin dioxygenase-like cupin family protein
VIFDLKGLPVPMQSTSLTSLADELTETARTVHSGRAAHTVHGGHDHDLRQTLLALLAGHDLAEHNSPGEATLQVLRGRVRLDAGDDSWDGVTGDVVAIPPARHSLTALVDSVFLLTVVVPQH